MSKGTGCKACLTKAGKPDEITIAFQPIVNVVKQTIFAHEALVRGIDGRSAKEVLAAAAGNLYSLDQACRVAAIEWAAALEVPALLSINFMPNAVYNPVTCLRVAAAAAERVGLPLSRIIFEVTEQEEMIDQAHVLSILNAYRAKGLLTAIDDFGAGYSGLNLLVEFQPDLLKLDIALIKDIGASRTKQIIVRHAAALCAELGVQVIAEGIETEDEYLALADLGIDLQQGYFFARPLTEGLPEVTFPNRRLDG